MVYFKIVAVFILLSFGLSGSSQTFGIKGGLGLSKLSGDNYSSLLTYQAGLLYNKKISERFFIQPELGFAKKGAESNVTIDGIELSFEYYTLTLPVMLGVQTNNGFLVHIGPAIHYLIEGNVLINDMIMTGNDVFSQADILLVSAIGYKISNRFGIEFRYEHGFKTQAQFYFTDINGLLLGFNEGGKDRSMLFSLFYLMPLRKA